MASALITQARIIENSGVVLMARVVKDSGAAIQQADISGLTCKVYNYEDGSLIASPTLTVAGNIFDSLQKPASWTVDSTGYNFSASLAGSNFPEGGVTYRVEVKFSPASGNAFYVLFDLQAL